MENDGRNVENKRVKNVQRYSLPFLDELSRFFYKTYWC